MANAYSVDDIIDFLDHASDRGLMPAATATALAVATRNVMGVLNDTEKADISSLDLDTVIKRFNNKRARDFNPTSLKEYGRRVHRALDLYVQWSSDPANFSIKTRTTKAGTKRSRKAGTTNEVPSDNSQDEVESHSNAIRGGGYSSSLPIRADWIVSLTNIPADLTAAEAERISKFIRMLAVE